LTCPLGKSARPGPIEPDRRKSLEGMRVLIVDDNGPAQNPYHQMVKSGMRETFGAAEALEPCSARPPRETPFEAALIDLYIAGDERFPALAQAIKDNPFHRRHQADSYEFFG